MASIEDFRKIMDGLDAWNEASCFIRPEDVERWNKDTQITLKTFPTLLKMSMTAPTVRKMLFVDNMFLIGAAEGAAGNAPPPKPSAKADDPDDEKIDADRPRAHQPKMERYTKLLSGASATASKSLSEGVRDHFHSKDHRKLSSR